LRNNEDEDEDDKDDRRQMPNSAVFTPNLETTENQPPLDCIAPRESQ